MLRKGLVALMMGVICAGSAIAEQPAQKRSTPASTGLVGWFKNKTSGKTEKSSSKISKSSTTSSAVGKSAAGKTSGTKPAVAANTTGKAGGASAASTASASSRPAASGATTQSGTTATAKPAITRPAVAKTTKPDEEKSGLFGMFRGSKSVASSGAESKSAAAKSSGSKPKTTNPSAGIERAVVADAERQAVQVRQTAAEPQDAAPEAPVEMTFAPAESALQPVPVQPVPVQQAPVVPNTNTVAGPQYFSATSTSMSNPLPVHPGNNWQAYEAPQPIHVVSQGQYWNAGHSPAPVGPVYSGYAPMSHQNGMYPQNGGGMYPQTGASLYPAPRPGIPHQVGGTMIENQAFHPHEMLYPHRYKAMYPPYYYKVNGGWMVTPFGVWSHEDWKLQGTTVDVKYKSHISPFTLFKPPVIR